MNKKTEFRERLIKKIGIEIQQNKEMSQWAKNFWLKHVDELADKFIANGRLAEEDLDEIIMHHATKELIRDALLEQITVIVKIGALKAQEKALRAKKQKLSEEIKKLQKVV